MGRRKFEDAFRDAFQDAELTPTEKVWSKVERDLDKASGDFKAAFLDAELEPTDTVWTNVELDLERAAGEKMRRRLMFYKMLAAASVVFAMCVAGVGYYAYNMQSQELIAQRNSTIESPIDKESEQENSLDQSTSAADASSSALTSENSAEQNASATGQEVAHESKTNDIHKSSSSQLALEEKDPTAEDSGNGAQSGKGTQPVVAGQSDHEIERRKSTVIRENSQRTDRATVAANNQALSNAADGMQPGVTDKNDLVKQRGGSTTAAVKISQENSGVVAAAGTESKRNPSGGVTQPDEDNAAAVVGENQQAESILNQSQLRTPGVRGQSNSFALDGTTRKPAPFFVPENAKVPAKQESVGDPFMLMMARLDDEAKAMNSGVKQKNSKKDFKGEQLWTSVGMTAGAYNTVNRSISNDMHTNAIQTATDQVKASGVAYSFGLSVGTKVSERWVVQGGVNYLNQMSDYTSNIIVGGNVVGQFNAMNGTNAVALEDNAPKFTRNDTEVNWAQTPPFAVSNTMEFISIPIEAGYMVVNKKVGVMVNAGVSTDLFIQNTEAANVDGAAKPVQTQERGSSDSPFRDLNFIGLLGTEVSYKVGLRYRVALTPGLRYPFNSMYKDDSRIQATPVTFDVGLKFRYIFQ